MPLVLKISEDMVNKIPGKEADSCKNLEHKVKGRFIL